MKFAVGENATASSAPAGAVAKTGTEIGAGESAASSSSTVPTIIEKKIRKTVKSSKSKPEIPVPPVNVAVTAVNTDAPATAILCPISCTSESARSSVLFSIDDEPLCEAEEEAKERDGMAEFLDGCEDRPATLSGSRVGYHRGWRRPKEGGKKVPPVLRVPLLLAPIGGDEKGTGTGKGKDVEGGELGEKKRLSESEYTRSRLSSIGEMSQLLTSLVKLRIRTLAFCGVRKLVELVLKYCLQSLKSSSSTEYLVECVASYRGTYCTVLHCILLYVLFLRLPVFLYLLLLALLLVLLIYYYQHSVCISVD